MVNSHQSIKCCELVGTSSSTALSSTLSSGSNKSNKGGRGGASGGSNVRNKPYRAAPIHPSFYYNDQFVSMAVLNQVYLYRYRTDDNNTNNSSTTTTGSNGGKRVSSSGNEVKRLQKLTVPVGSYKCAQKWSIEGSKNITAFACVNSVLSPLLFAATSNKAFCIIDVVHGNICRNIENIHDKAIHSIALPQPTIYAQVSQQECNLFLTSGYDNVIQLWDLRCPTVSMRYTGHVNRREAVGCALSPCLRFIATGSEDRMARLVDIRTGNTLQTYIAISASFHCSLRLPPLPPHKARPRHSQSRRHQPAPRDPRPCRTRSPPPATLGPPRTPPLRRPATREALGRSAEGLEKR